MIRRWLPYPILSALLLLIWLLLSQSVAPGTILLGALLGIALAKMFGLLRPPKAHLRNYPLLGRLFLRVVLDIFRSNLAVGRLILCRDRRVRSGFVAIPLQLTDRYGLAVLACIITSTPGTIWVSYDPSANILLIHVLDLVDEAGWTDTIKQRYERPLLEIFQ
ncbi:cation:proton antiporter [Rhodanobacter thiooxydans]|uniref:Cation:proton antiporter n=1 Tax=Rhodanobacter thiooxydans TaxID=416169 RepID=A0A154QGN6_9GAMM|nr:Na+/H+ antiporter subunit E [Rhodanobacter thiooxydans]EIM03339.1 monovalent cation/H+ antiporter subunit E [Rhodanobacter thiooxydans LCS2]KZC23365.1 cation:proton antiporter [Rhodanobacter thiooxydans]MCW0201436.1 Na+/H+ antiporter subunit E [Rhodanobacter thiooxydans]